MCDIFTKLLTERPSDVVGSFMKLCQIQLGVNDNEGIPGSQYSVSPSCEAVKSMRQLFKVINLQCATNHLLIKLNLFMRRAVFLLVSFRNNKLLLSRVTFNFQTEIHDPEDKNINDLEVDLPNLMEECHNWEQAGVGINRDEYFILLVSMKILMENNASICSIRLWGKMFGLMKNYYILECEVKDEDGEVEKMVIIIV